MSRQPPGRSAGEEAESPPPPVPTRTSLDPLQQLDPDSLLAGRYRVRRLLGVGGMGVVYLAHDTELDLEVALKLLRPDFAAQTDLIDRFRRELVLARQVSHRNVVRIHDIGQHGDLYFLTMDFIAGRSLRDLLEEEGALDVERALEIARQLAEALAVAHEEEVVHRDLKPSNVLIDDGGRAYITDFGVARSLSAVGLTQTGTVVGTPDYLSPEQARGETVDGRSDIYSLGLMLFEMITGELPFRSGSMAEVVAQRISGRLQLDRLGGEVPAGVRRVIRRCLESEPRRRYPSAAALATDLADPERAGRGPSGRWLRAALVALAVVAAAAGGAWWWARTPAPGEQPAAPAAEEGRLAVAVLPLIDETGTPREAWLASGLAELLAELLAESPTLTVVDPQRVFQTLADLKLPQGEWTDSSLRQVAELFDAERLVHGKLRAVGEGLRVDARMVARDPSGELDAQPVSAEVESRGNALGLVGQLGREVRDRLELAPPDTDIRLSSDAAAVQAYGEGSALLDRGETVAAVPALERAVEADSGFGAAWHRLAQAYQALGRPDDALAAVERAVASLADAPGRLTLQVRAEQALLLGEPGRAVEILGELRRRYPHDLEAAVALADAHGLEGSLGQAIQVLEQVVAEAPNHPRAWYLLAKFSILAGNSRQAIDEYLVRAMVIQNRLRNPQGRADVLNAFGVAYRELGELDRAEENYRQAGELRREIGDRRGYATCLRNLAQVEAFRGEYQAASDNLDQALAILEDLGDEAGLADLHNDLGQLEEARGRFAPVLEHYRRALSLRRRLGDRRAEAESLNNVGYAYYLLGDYDNASVYWHQALDLYRETGNAEGEVLATQSLGQLQLAQGDWEEATRSYLSALEASRQVEFTPATALSLGQLGKLAELRGRFAAALASYDEALALFGELKDARGLAEFGLGRAATLLELGLWPAARGQLEKVAAWLEGTANHEQLTELSLLRERLALAESDAEAAAEQLARARQEAEASGSPQAVLHVRLAAGRRQLAAGQADAARRELAAVLADAEELGHAALRLAAGEALASAELAAGRAQPAARTAQSALRLVRSVGEWAGAYRLHRLLAAASERSGRPQEAAASREQAARELDRMRRGLEPAQLEAFSRLVEETGSEQANG